MKIVCLGDLHLLWDKPIGRKDDAHKVQMDKMKFVLDWALDNDAIILQPGDFFDTARSWHLTSAYSEFFGSYLYTPLYAVYGQHDTYMYSEKTRHATGLGVLIANKLIRLLNSKGYVLPGRNNAHMYIYGASFGQEIPKPKIEKDQLNILVIHKMIVGNEKLGYWQKDGDFVYAENFLDEYKDYDLIVCGDCHRKFMFEQDGRYIVNSGPLFRKEADMYNMTEASPGFYFYNTNNKKLKWIDVPHESADKVLSRNHIERQEEIDEAMEEFVSKMKINDDEMTSVDFMSNLISFLDSNKVEDGVKDILSEVMDEELK